MIHLSHFLRKMHKLLFRSINNMKFPINIHSNLKWKLVISLLNIHLKLFIKFHINIIVIILRIDRTSWRQQNRKQIRLSLRLQITLQIMLNLRLNKKSKYNQHHCNNYLKYDQYNSSVWRIYFYNNYHAYLLQC